MNALATYIPVTEEMLADAALWNPWPRIGRDLLRRLTAVIFGEDWSSAWAELQRLEFGQPMPWDSYVYEDDEEDY